MSAQETKNAPAGKKTTVLLATGAVVIVVLVGVIILLLFGDNEPKRNVVVNEGNVGDIILEMTELEPVAAGQFEVNMNSTWYFETGDKPSPNAYVANAANNSHDVYFDVVDKGSGEVILQSPVIPRGSHMERITLDKDLAAGTYDCTLIYHLVDEDQETLGTLNMSLTVVVEG